MDDTTGLPSINIGWLKALKELASNPQTAGRVIKDNDWLGILVLLMDVNDNEPMVTLSLEIVRLLADRREYRPRLRDSLGMMPQLENMLNNTKTPSAIYTLVEELHTLLLEVTNSGNHGNHPNIPSHEPLQDIKHTSTNQPKPQTKMAQKTRRNSMLVQGPGLGKSGKTTVLQIRGMVNRDDMDLCRSLLVKVKGVISVTFDFKKKRSILRCRNDLKTEVLVQAINKSITMTADQVVKDEQGEEVLVSFGSKQSEARSNKENEEMPDYPPDDDSPVRGDKNMARLGGAADSPVGWGFMKSVGSYLATSFYW